MERITDRFLKSLMDGIADIFHSNFFSKVMNFKFAKKKNGSLME